MEAILSVRMTKRTRLTVALELRDVALTVLQQYGQWKTVQTSRSPGGNIRILSASVRGLDICCRTPFQRIPKPGNSLKYRAAQLGLSAPKNLPYGLDIWAPKKVMNIEWDDKGKLILVSLHPGHWQTELIELGGGHRPSRHRP